MECDYKSLCGPKAEQSVFDGFRARSSLSGANNPKLYQSMVAFCAPHAAFNLVQAHSNLAAQLTGHPSDNDFSDKSEICEHDSSEMLVNLLQCLLSGSVAASVIFLHSVRSKCSMLWQC